MTVEKIIEERQNTHGEFVENSRATWAILAALQSERNWHQLSDAMKHALYMIAHKMGRIVAGNPETQDHWEDIAGYATLVLDRLREPVVPYGPIDDVYAALATKWGIGRDAAKERALGLAHDVKEERERVAREERERVAREERLTFRRNGASGRPGTPDDGGHHAAQAVAELADELHKAVQSELKDKK